jgi:hypothetical protein
MPSQVDGITVRESSQSEFCNTIALKADISSSRRADRLLVRIQRSHHPDPGQHRVAILLDDWDGSFRDFAVYAQYQQLIVPIDSAH